MDHKVITKCSPSEMPEKERNKFSVCVLREEKWLPFLLQILTANFDEILHFASSIRWSSVGIGALTYNVNTKEVQTYSGVNRVINHTHRYDVVCINTSSQLKQLV